jgi:hypothetical protein
LEKKLSELNNFVYHYKETTHNKGLNADR